MLENEPELEKYESTEDAPTECEFADESEISALAVGFTFNVVIFVTSFFLLLCLTEYIIGGARLTILGVTVTVLVDFAAAAFMMIIPNKLINIVFRKHPEHKAKALFIYAMTLATAAIITINGGFALTY